MTWAPEQIGNASMTVVASDLGLGSGATISSWTDRVGSYVFGDQGVSAKRPTYDLTTLGGAPSVRFTSASSQILRYGAVNPISTSQKGTVWAVVRLATNAALATVCASGSETSSTVFVRWQIASTGVMRIATNVGGSNITGTGSTVLATGTNYLLEWTTNGSLWTMKVNGVAETVSGGNDGSWFGDEFPRANFTVGGLKNNTTETQFLDGWLGALGVIDVGISTADLGALYRWVTSTFGIVLPVSANTAPALLATLRR